MSVDIEARLFYGYIQPESDKEQCSTSICRSRNRAMSQTLDELAEILTQIEAKHGMIQDMSDHLYVRDLHAKARECIEKLRVEQQNILSVAQDEIIKEMLFGMGYSLLSNTSRAEVAYQASRQQDIIKVMHILPGKYQYEQVASAIIASGVHPSDIYASLSANEHALALARFYEALNKQ